MVVIRGVNVFPTAVEEIIRSCGGVAEYRVHVGKDQALAELKIEIEPQAPCADPTGLAQKLQQLFQDLLSLRVSVQTVPSLPRFELKAKRWLRDSDR